MAEPASDAPAYARRLKRADLPERTLADLAVYHQVSGSPAGAWDDVFLAAANRKDAITESRNLPSESRAWSPEAKLDHMLSVRFRFAWNELHARFPQWKDPYAAAIYKARGEEQRSERSRATPWGDREGWAEEPTLPIRMVQAKEGERAAEPAYQLYNRLVREKHYRPFRTSTGDPRVAIPTEHGLEIRRPLGKDGGADREFVNRIGYELFTREGHPVPKRDLNEAAVALAGRSRDRSLPDCRVVQLSIRLAPWGPFSSLLDLSDRERRCVLVGPDGWTIETLGHPVFDQRGGTRALPEPKRAQGPDGWRRVERIWDFIALPERLGPEEPRLLAVALLVHFILAPRSPKPIGLFGGNEGAGKSSAAERFQEIIDPSTPRIIGAASLEDPKELVSLVMNHAVLNVDNVSTISSRLSDDLARLSTGVGFAKRELFTDSGEVLGDVCPLVLINGITATPWAPDLLSRVSFLTVAQRPRLIPKDQLDLEWRLAHPEILGGLLDLAAATARVLRDDPPPLLSSRMADHVRIGLAVAIAMGRPRDDFIAAWTANENRQASAAAENPWVSALSEFFGIRTSLSTPVTASEVTIWVNDHCKASFPSGVNTVQVGLAIKRVQKTLDRLGIYVRSKGGHNNQNVYYRAVEDEFGRQGPALDDTAALRVWEAQSASPTAPSSPVADGGKVQKPAGEVDRPPPSDGGAGPGLPQTSLSTSPIDASPENRVVGGSGGGASKLPEPGEGGSTPAGRGDKPEGSGPGLTEESFDGETRGDRARREWARDHPEGA